MKFPVWGESEVTIEIAEDAARAFDVKVIELRGDYGVTNKSLGYLG